MQDIEALASRIILIGKGQILMDGTLEDIRQGPVAATHKLQWLPWSWDKQKDQLCKRHETP